MLQKIGKVQRSPRFRDNRIPFSSKRLKNHKDVRNTVAHIHRINFLRLSRRTGDSNFFNQLSACFINAYNGPERIVRALIDLQYIFHFRYILRIRLWNSPFFDKPWLNHVFFITSQTVLSVINLKPNEFVRNHLHGPTGMPFRGSRTCNQAYLRFYLTGYFSMVIFLRFPA